jgi:H+/Cl- antiporter ClcA
VRVTPVVAFIAALVAAAVIGGIVGAIIGVQTTSPGDFVRGIEILGMAFVGVVIGLASVLLLTLIWRLVRGRFANRFVKPS